MCHAFFIHALHYGVWYLKSFSNIRVFESCYIQFVEIRSLFYCWFWINNLKPKSFSNIRVFESCYIQIVGIRSLLLIFKQSPETPTRYYKRPTCYGWAEDLWMFSSHWLFVALVSYKAVSFKKRVYIIYCTYVVKINHNFTSLIYSTSLKWYCFGYFPISP